MSSAEPIRPVAPNEGLLVRRAEPVRRVTRDDHAAEDEQARDRRRQEDRRRDALAEQHARIWTTRPDAEPAELAGTYDDHGHVADPDATTVIRRHLDTSI